MTPSAAVNVEVLYFDGCPNHEALLPHLRELLASTEIAADIQLVEVHDAGAAERRRFLGSPTVRIDGQDVEPGGDQRNDFGLKCRLYAGMELAHVCGANPLVERAHEELVATGARPRRIMRTGIDALTASQKRVARMAADGMTNREIAQALFVTARTVEVHLTHAYQKLNISSREELPQVLRS